MNNFISKRKRLFKYLLIPLVLLVLLLMSLMLPPIMDWIEIHEECYTDTKEAYPEGHNPEFLPASAKDIRIVSTADNGAAWMTFKSNETLPLDSSIFVESDPDSLGISILPNPPLFWWTEKWKKQVDEFWFSANRLKITPPFSISWWPDDLSGDKIDTKLLKQKYRFFSTKVPYQISGLFNKKVTVDYVIIIVNRSSQQAYVWIIL
jgi:hypothetical protein